MREETTTATKATESIVYDRTTTDEQIKKFIEENWNKMTYQQLIHKVKQMAGKEVNKTNFMQVIPGSEVRFISEEECLKIGGHCWVDENAVGASNPPTYFRHCKHCNKRQYGRRNEAFEWRDWK